MPAIPDESTTRGASIMNRTTTLLAACLLLASPLAGAAVSDAEFQALKDSLAELTRKLGDLEQKLADAKAAEPPQATATTQAVAAAPAPVASSWTETVSLQGDFRYRYENIDPEGSDKRNRNRIRARAGLVAKPQAGLEIGFGLATGENGDPVSTNQTLGGGGSRKDIYLDLAYFDYDFAPGASLIGGKFRNFYYRPGKQGLLWDSDWNPEGMGVVYEGEVFFANALGTYLDGDSRGSRSGETFVYGGQAGFRLPLGAARLTAGAGYYDLRVEGKQPYYGDVDDPDFFGNSFRCGDVNDPQTCVYANDYTELEGFAELAINVVNLPLSLFVDYVTNTDADAFDTGWAAGVMLGQAKKKGTWELGYTYQDLEADAVLGLVTDSDFGGGGTDTSGHVLRGGYALSDKTNMAFSYFINENGENAGSKRDYDRLQLDVNFKY